MTIKLPAQENQTAINLQHWTQLRTDPLIVRELAKFAGRVETDRHVRIILLPLPGVSHGCFQSEIGCLLHTLLPDGRVVIVCPISTLDGVKGADVIWVSRPRLAATNRNDCLTDAPEICVEVFSPDNTRIEMAEKKAIYFAAGAKEVWFCADDGKMTFFIGAASRGQKSSKCCPEFPRQIQF